MIIKSLEFTPNGRNVHVKRNTTLGTRQTKPVERFDWTAFTGIFSRARYQLAKISPNSEHYNVNSTEGERHVNLHERKTETAHIRDREPRDRNAARSHRER